MAIDALGGGGFDYVSGTEPSAPDIGETWYDTSAENGAGKIYADLGSGATWHVLPSQQELQTGKTRELLLLLQDSPIPEVVDPMNLQSSLSDGYQTDGNQDYLLFDVSANGTADRPNDDDTAIADGTGLIINPNKTLETVEAVVSANQSDVSEAKIEETDGTTLETVTGTWVSGDTIAFNTILQSGTEYRLYVSSDAGDSGRYINDSSNYPYTSTAVDITSGYTNGGGQIGNSYSFTSVTGKASPDLSGHVTDQYSAPTTAPADFKAWNSIRAQDVTTGGSTATKPVEFDLLDSSDTTLTSSRIPKSELADSAFKLRGRVYSGTAGSDGDGSYTIPTTGAGGHYGIPILSVVTVKQNGSTLDSANWEFDGVDTITIDTSAVTISSGDTIDIAYDFDVFDSTLQPRAYLNRATASETSPSISHFRYEYVV